MSDPDHQGGTDGAPRPNEPAFFDPSSRVVFACVVLLGVLLRWIGFDERPVHHDESLHATYGKYFFDFPYASFYRYDPMLHGPFLYTCLFFVYLVFDISEWAARLPCVVIGTGLVFLPYLLRRRLTPPAVLFLTAAVALSPTLVYWSRFIREDSFVLCGIALCLYGVLGASSRNRGYFVAAGFLLHVASKENVFVHLALLLGYVVYEALFGVVTRRRGDGLRRPAPLMMSDWCRRHPGPAAVAAAGFLLGYLLLYTAGFQYTEGPLDFLWRKSIAYWWDKHHTERIVGPFMFHLYVLSWYEGVFSLAVIAQTVHFYRSSGRFGARAAGAWFLLSVAAAVYVRDSAAGAELLKSPFLAFFKLKDGLDLAGFLVLPVHAVALTTLHLLRGERGLAFAGYCFTSLLFTYSFLGEKVPWLSVYPFVAGLVYLALYGDTVLRSRPIAGWREYPVGTLLNVTGTVLFVTGVLILVEERGMMEYAKPSEAFLGFFALPVLGAVLVAVGVLDEEHALFAKVDLRRAVFGFSCVGLTVQCVQTNFVWAGRASEYISQVHTTHEFDRAARKIVATLKDERVGRGARVWVGGDATWPSTWYFRDLRERYDFSADAAARAEFLYQIDDAGEGKTAPPGYRGRRIHFRGWWVPDFSAVSLRRFLKYALFHQPWNEPGFADVMLYTRQSKPAGAAAPAS